MKIEIGESLFYSWLRHVKDCQIVQNNWKVSPEWDLRNEDKLIAIMETCDQYFRTTLGYDDVFKGNSGVLQLIRQGECDAIGLSMHDGTTDIYAVDVAFHEGGVNYGDRPTTVKKIAEKCIRTAMCILGYFDSGKAEVIFAAPKINNAVENDLIPVFKGLNSVFTSMGYGFNFRLICNDGFSESVLEPILLVCDGVADTSELFMRSYKLFSMFGRGTVHKDNLKADTARKRQSVAITPAAATDEDPRYKEMKIGRLAQTVFAGILERDGVSEDEVKLLITAEYSKRAL